jgi:hypothetical protein
MNPAIGQGSTEYDTICRVIGVQPFRITRCTGCGCRPKMWSCANQHSTDRSPLRTRCTTLFPFYALIFVSH